MSHNIQDSTALKRVLPSSDAAVVMLPPAHHGLFGGADTLSVGGQEAVDGAGLSSPHLTAPDQGYLGLLDEAFCAAINSGVEAALHGAKDMNVAMKVNDDFAHLALASTTDSVNASKAFFALQKTIQDRIASINSAQGFLDSFNLGLTITLAALSIVGMALGQFELAPEAIEAGDAADDAAAGGAAVSGSGSNVQELEMFGRNLGNKACAEAENGESNLNAMSSTERNAASAKKPPLPKRPYGKNGSYFQRVLKELSSNYVVKACKILGNLFGLGVFGGTQIYKGISDMQIGGYYSEIADSRRAQGAAEALYQTTFQGLEGAQMAVKQENTEVMNVVGLANEVSADAGIVFTGLTRIAVRLAQVI